MTESSPFHTTGHFSYWNYRVRGCTQDATVPGTEPEYVYDIIEVYYDADDKIIAYTKDGMSPSGGYVDELGDDLDNMRRALKLPVLHEEDLPNG